MLAVGASISIIKKLQLRQDKHPFNGLFSTTNWVSHHENGETILDFNEATDYRVAVASAGPFAPQFRQITSQRLIFQFFAGQMLFLTPNQHCQHSQQLRQDIVTSRGRCPDGWRSAHTPASSELPVLNSRESSAETTPHGTPACHLHRQRHT